jgi:hypothetical protein
MTRFHRHKIETMAHLIEKNKNKKSIPANFSDMDETLTSKITSYELIHCFNNYSKLNKNMHQESCTYKEFLQFDWKLFSGTKAERPTLNCSPDLLVLLIAFGTLVIPCYFLEMYILPWKLQFGMLESVVTESCLYLLYRA